MHPRDPHIRARLNPPRTGRQAVAILIPCHNEAMTIATVVERFRDARPDAAIYVFDNASTDATAELARAAGATVVYEARVGKGHVVQSMFRYVDADVYVMVDGDNTYPPDAIDQLVEPILAGTADMVIGSRLQNGSRSDFRIMNLLGNRMFKSLLSLLFGTKLTDLLSGYRAFSRELVANLPLCGRGFETETEMTIKALHRGFRIAEVPVQLVARPAGSRSKIRIVRDGMLILTTILALFRDYKPLTLFGTAGLVTVAGGISAWSGLFRGAAASEAGSPLGPVLVIVGSLLVLTGLILHSVARHFQEMEARLQIRSGLAPPPLHVPASDRHLPS